MGPLAQLVAHLHDAQGVTGSSPVRPTNCDALKCWPQMDPLWTTCLHRGSDIELRRCLPDMGLFSVSRAIASAAHRMRLETKPSRANEGWVGAEYKREMPR